MSKRKRAKEDASKAGSSKKPRTDDHTTPPPIDGPPGEAPQTSGALPKSDNGAMDLDKNGLLASTRDEQPMWRTQSVGGRILDLDPVFSQDEENYILAYTSGVKVFSCKTSSLVQFLPLPRTAPVIGLTLSPSHPNELVIGSADGQILTWNWADNIETRKLDVGIPIQALAVVSQVNEDKPRDIAYVAQGSEGAWNIAAYFLDTSEQQQEGRILCNSNTLIDALQVVGNGRIIVASSGHRVIIATKRGAKYFPVERLVYQLKEFNCTDAIVSFKAYLRDSSSEGSAAPEIDIAVGTSSGFIYLYRDIINQLNAAKEAGSLPSVNRMHWHRNAVTALDWSKDGEYLISGGAESVLVLWQLDRAQQSYLPHLSSPIRRVVVAPSGSTYGVTLNDNSSMVLKVRTLEPETSVADPLLFDDTAKLRGHVSSSAYLRQMPAVLPQGRSPIALSARSSRILFATQSPSHITEDNKISTPSPYLQIFDYKKSTQITKQAIARTLVTDRKVDTQGLPLEEPRVVLLKSSPDEQWLATVDEWMPPSDEFNGLKALVGHWRQARLARLESSLRFWVWRESKKSWDMIEKVDISASHHSHDLRRNKIILDLISDPERTRFYTIGDDFVVRVWIATVRTRNGLRVKDEQGNEIWAWKSQEIGSLPLFPSHEETHDLSGRICVSKDGSLLVAAITTSRGGVVCSFDLRSRKRLSIEHHRTLGAIRYMGIVGSCIVALSKRLAIWNVVDSASLCSVELDLAGISEVEIGEHFHVACDDERNLLAIASPTAPGTTVTFLAGAGLEEQSSLHLPFRVLALLSAPAQKGFLVLSADSEMTLLSSSAPVREITEVVLPSRPIGLGSVFGKLQANLPPTDDRSHDHDALMAEDDAKFGAGAEALRQVFDAAQPLTAPSVLSMFQQVTKVISREMK